MTFREYVEACNKLLQENPECAEYEIVYTQDTKYFANCFKTKSKPQVIWFDPLSNDCANTKYELHSDDAYKTVCIN